MDFRLTVGWLLVFSITFYLYFITSTPAVGGGDSGELMVVSNELGVAHPPGYPSFVLGSKLVQTIVRTANPDITAAFGITFANVLFGALASANMYAACYLVTGSSWISFISSMQFSTAPAVWKYNVVAEVFSLNNLFVVTFLVLALSYDRRRSTVSDRFLVGCAFWSGLSTTNQHTVVLFLLPMVTWVMGVEAVHRRMRIKWLFIYGLAVLVGMLPYIHIILSPLFYDRKNSWGDTGTWDGFWQHFLRRDYGTFSLGNEKLSYIRRDVTLAWIKWSHNMWMQYNDGAFLGFVVLGYLFSIFQSFTARRVTCLAAMVLTWIFYMTFFNTLNNLPIEDPLFLGVLERFWIQPLTISTIMFAVGLNFARKVLGRLSFSVLIVSAVGVFLAGSTQLVLQDQSPNTYHADFGRCMMSTLPPNAILITKGDILTNAARFVQAMEKYRTDVALLDLEMMRGKWYLPRVKKFLKNITFPGKMYAPEPGCFDAKTFIEKNYKKRRMFVAYEFTKGDNDWEKKFMKIPHGVADEIIPKYSGAMPIDKLRTYLQEISVYPKPWEVKFPRGDDKYGADSWEQVVRGDYWAVLHRTGVFLVKPAIFVATEKEDLRRTKENPYYVSLAAGIEYLRYVMHNGTKYGVPYRTKCLTAKFYGLALNTYLRYAPSSESVDIMQEVVETFDLYLKYVNDTKEGANEKQFLTDIENIVNQYRKNLEGR